MKTNKKLTGNFYYDTNFFGSVILMVEEQWQTEDKNDFSLSPVIKRYRRAKWLDLGILIHDYNFVYQKRL